MPDHWPVADQATLQPRLLNEPLKHQTGRDGQLRSRSLWRAVKRVDGALQHVDEAVAQVGGVLPEAPQRRVRRRSSGVVDGVHPAGGGDEPLQRDGRGPLRHYAARSPSQSSKAPR